MITRNKETGPKSFAGSLSEPGQNLGAITPGERRTWDVDAALGRVAGGNAESFKERLRELALSYRAEEDDHLSFDQVQTLATGSPSEALSTKQIAHVHGCHFCRTLIDTIVGSKEERDAFLQLVRQHERPAELVRAPKRAWVPAARAFEIRWDMGLAAAAAAVIVGFIGFALGGLKNSGSPFSASIATVDWSKATLDCEAQSKDGAGCDLLTAAAKLTTEGQTHLARPVFVSALERAGVQGDAVQRINATLAALPNSQGTRAAEGRDANSGSNPNVSESGPGGEAASERILTSAKIDFASGRPIQGYEHVASYVAKVADRPDVARAVQAGFIAPIRQAEQHKTTPPAKASANDGTRSAAPAK